MWTTRQSGVVHNQAKRLKWKGYRCRVQVPPGLPQTLVFLAKSMALWTTRAIFAAWNINGLRGKWTTKRPPTTQNGLPMGEAVRCRGPAQNRSPL